MEIFRDLRIVDAPGSPKIVDACRPWVMEFAASVFGAYDKETGRRLIRYFFLLVSKKNSKSTIAAAIMLTALMRNWRKSAEFLILAPTIEVANNSFFPARDMIQADEELADLLHAQPSQRLITHKNTGAILKVVAADNETVSGKKAVGVLIDELWLFGKRPNAENMLREATGGLASRPEGFVIYLSTQSDEPPAGVFRQKLHEFRDIRDGKRSDPKSLGVLYEFPKRMIESEAFREPDNFYVTNPNLGASVDREYLVDEFEKATLNGQVSLGGFAAKHLNVEIGIGLRTNRWPGAEYWGQRADDKLSALSHWKALDALLERSEVVTVGIDGGGLDDLFGLAVLGREPTEIEVEVEVNGQKTVQRMKRWLAWCHAWCHAGVLERRKSIASKLLEFKAAGELDIVGDELSDLGAIAEIVQRVKDRGILGNVGCDPAGLGEFVDVMESIDVTQENSLLFGVGQGYRLMNAIKTAERRLASGMLLHCGGVMMPWIVSNVKIEPTATAIRATKQNAGDAKIDPWAALINAVDRMSLNPASAMSVYDSEERGFLVV